MSTIVSTFSSTTQRIIVAAAIGFTALAPAVAAIEMASAPVALASDDGVDLPHPAAPHAPITHNGPGEGPAVILPPAVDLATLPFRRR